jgi:acetyl esterase/lipase
MKTITGLLHLRRKEFISADRVVAGIEKGQSEAPVARALTRTHNLQYDSVDGMPVITLIPRNTEPCGELLYLHGGAYVHGILGPHWQIIRRLTRDTPLRVTVPLYWLAPKHTASEILPKLDILLNTDTGVPLVVAGDSAGGGLTMASAARARDSGRNLPAALLLFSPWVDASMTNPKIRPIEPRDPILASAGLLWCAEQWAGELGVDHPWISPLNDSLDGLPPIAVFQGGQDIFLPDAEAFAAKALAAGTDTEIHVYPDAFHVFVGLPQLPESRHALSRATAIIQDVTAFDAAH